MNQTPQLPPVIPVKTIARWLPEIFREGTSNRNYVIREISAKTIFVMLYVGAVEGTGRYVRPDQVTKMSDAQAVKSDQATRDNWADDSLARRSALDLKGRWYAPNTREPIRDETLRLGLVAFGAVLERADLATTSAKPRYALARHFADLLIALSVSPKNAPALIQQWQRAHLSAVALSRINLLRRGTVDPGSSSRIRVTFPNGEARLMRPGPSTLITKAVIEEFAKAFLKEPGVILVSESGDKIVARDDGLARSLGLHLDYSKNLPDIILADIATEAPKVVFVEVVATDGPVNEQRKQALLRVAEDARFETRHIYFVSAFADRSASTFRKLAAEIAWGTFVWFMSEPDKLVAFRDGRQDQLPHLLAMG
jgi:hypothetical protein